MWFRKGDTVRVLDGSGRPTRVGKVEELGERWVRVRFTYGVNAWEDCWPSQLELVEPPK